LIYCNGMLRLLQLCLLFPFYLLAQQEGEHFWSGSLSFNTTANKSFRNNGSSATNAAYMIDLRVNRGKFISNNRMVYGGVIANIVYYEPGGNNARYATGLQGGLAKYHQLLPGFYASLNHELSYVFGWNGGRSAVRNHTVSYRFSPGLTYRMSERFALQLNLALVTIDVTQQSSASNRNESQRISVHLLSGTSLANLNFGLFYFPFQLQRKQTK
jgi:hypothetical protein